MNVSRFASDMSFILIQQPAVLIRVLNVALGQYVFPLFKKGGTGVWSIPYQTLSQVFHLETILLLSIITSRLSGASILKATQVGQLFQYMLLAFYYMALGRFAIDLFHTKGRDKSKDWQIYLVIMLIFVGIYGLMVSWSLIACKR
jgi:hypothetical protein